MNSVKWDGRNSVEWNYEPLLRHLICIIFHHYLPWFPSEYHLRIMFDHSYCQNIHSHSQNHCFKEFAHFRRKTPATKRPFAWGGVGWNAIRQNAVWTCSILTRGFPYNVKVMATFLPLHWNLFQNWATSDKLCLEKLYVHLKSSLLLHQNISLPLCQKSVISSCSQTINSA